MGIFFDFGETSTERGNVLEGLKVLCDCQHVYFILTLLYCGFALGITQTFLFWHLQDLGGTQFLFSCISAVQCASEVVMYLMSGSLITRFGYVKLLYAGLVWLNHKILVVCFRDQQLAGSAFRVALRNIDSWCVVCGRCAT